jgi:hypothetical protein
VKIAIVLELFVVPICKWSINPIFYPNPAYNRSIHVRACFTEQAGLALTLQTCILEILGLNLDETKGIEISRGVSESLEVSVTIVP